MYQQMLSIHTDFVRAKGSYCDIMRRICKELHIVGDYDTVSYKGPDVLATSYTYMYTFSLLYIPHCSLFTCIQTVCMQNLKKCRDYMKIKYPNSLICANWLSKCDYAVCLLPCLGEFPERCWLDTILVNSD